MRIYEGQYFLQLRSLCEGQFRFKIQNLSDVRGKLTGAVLFSGRGLGKKLSIFSKQDQDLKRLKGSGCVKVIPQILCKVRLTEGLFLLHSGMMCSFFGVRL